MAEFATAITPYIPLVSSVVGAGASIYAAKQSSKAQKSAIEASKQMSEAIPRTLPVTEMPVSPSLEGGDDTKILAAKRRSLAEQMQRRGRASTVLTADDALGG